MMFADFDAIAAFAATAPQFDEAAAAAARARQNALTKPPEPGSAVQLPAPSL